MLVASEGGVTFWTGNHPLAAGDGDLAANPELKRAQPGAASRRIPDLSEEQMEPLYYREALRLDPRASAATGSGSKLRKLFYLVVPIGPSYRVHSAALLCGVGRLVRTADPAGRDRRRVAPGRSARA